MESFGFLFIIFGATGLVSGDILEEAKPVSTSYPEHGGMSSADVDRIVQRLEDSDTRIRQLLDRVTKLEDQVERDLIQQEEIRNLKMAPNHRISRKNSASMKPVENQYIESSHYFATQGKRSVFIVDEKDGKTIPISISNSTAGVPHTDQQRIVRQVSNTSPHVTFSAFLSPPEVQLGVHQQVVFDSVFVNEGNAYDGSTGSFTAPILGTYAFSASLMSKFHSEGHFAFTKNGVKVTQMFLAGSELGKYSTTAGSIVIQLQQGDALNVYSIESNTTIVGYAFTTFSGFLLHKIENPLIVGK